MNIKTQIKPIWKNHRILVGCELLNVVGGATNKKGDSPKIDSEEMTPPPPPPLVEQASLEVKP